MRSLRSRLEEAFTQHEWLPLLFILVLSVGGLVLAGHWADTGSAWPAFGIAAGLGVGLAAAWTIPLLLRGRLFLTKEVDKRRSRRRIDALMIPLGYVGAAISLPILRFAPDQVRTAVLGFDSAVLLGLWPSVLANSIRLRRERRAPS